jgi:hypothetical protein
MFLSPIRNLYTVHEPTKSKYHAEIAVDNDVRLRVYWLRILYVFVIAVRKLKISYFTL